jgi:hypothetical protein
MKLTTYQKTMLVNIKHVPQQKWDMDLADIDTADSLVKLGLVATVKNHYVTEYVLDIKGQKFFDENYNFNR